MADDQPDNHTTKQTEKFADAERRESELEMDPTDAPPVNSSILPLPYPGFENPDSEDLDLRSFSKFTANTYTAILNENPEHPKRDKILKRIAEEKKLADMDDQQFFAHQMYEANPVYKLTKDEKLHCIRTLPIPIVNKLFPHL